MAEARKKFPKIILPAGPFRFPKLTEPDYGNEKFPRPEGRYIVTVVYNQNSAAARQAIKELTPLFKAAEQEIAEKFEALSPKERKRLGKYTMAPLFEVMLDRETAEETGDIAFKATMAASGKTKKGPKAGKIWNRKPMLFDAKGNRMGWNPLTKKETKLPDIWGGTVGKVSAEVGTYFVEGTGVGGLKLYLDAVQILDLATAGQRSADSFGFGVEEGYESSEMEEDVPATQTAESDDATDGDF